MRTTKDLILELQQEADGAESVALAVGFKSETKLIWSSTDDADSLHQLNSLMREGGLPLGLIRATRKGCRTQLSSRVLEEFEGEDATLIGGKLADLLRRTGESLERQFGIEVKLS